MNSSRDQAGGQNIGLLLEACLTTFYNPVKLFRDVSPTVGWTLLHESVIKNMFPQTYQQTNVMEAILQLKSPFPEVDNQTICVCTNNRHLHIHLKKINKFLIKIHNCLNNSTSNILTCTIMLKTMKNKSYAR